MTCSAWTPADRGLTPHVASRAYAWSTHEQSLEMTFVERNQQVKTFATKAPHSLAHRVCLGGSHGRPQNSHPQVRQILVDVPSEDAVAIVDQEAVGMIARQRFPELLERPLPPWDGP
jgi:hypothetical protein